MQADDPDSNKAPDDTGLQPWETGRHAGGSNYGHATRQPGQRGQRATGDEAAPPGQPTPAVPPASPVDHAGSAGAGQPSTSTSSSSSGMGASEGSTRTSLPGDGSSAPDSDTKQTHPADRPQR